MSESGKGARKPKEKKITELKLRIEESLKESFERHCAWLSIDSMSSAIRTLMANELNDPKLTPGSSLGLSVIEVKDAPTATFTGRDGRTYGLRLLPFRCTPLLIMLDLSGPEPEWCNWTQAKGVSPTIDRALDVMNGRFDWDTPDYRAVCAALGFSPDRGRPKFRPECAELGAALVRRVSLELSPADPGGHGRLNFLYDVVDLLRADMRPEISVLNRVRRDTVDFQDEPRIGEILNVLDAIEAGGSGQLHSSTLIGTAIRFLPSGEGAGFIATISGWYGNHESDGWVADSCRDLRGIALYPERITPWTRTVVDRLARQGVRFLTEDQAIEYLKDEGAYWAWRSGYGADTHGLPARQPQWMERLWWTIADFLRRRH